MLIGYARVSTRDQNPDGQLDALTAAGVEERHTYIDKASGTLERRPQFDAALSHVRAGDVPVVTKLDRMARSVKHLCSITEQLRELGADLKVLDQGIDTTTPVGRLVYHILAAVAEVEHDLIVERTQVGLASARARGRKGGRRPKMTPPKIAQARAMFAETGEDGKPRYTVAQIADVLSVSRPTLYAYLSEVGRATA